jgi:hypothetical protein
MFVLISHLIKPPYQTLHKKIHPIGSGKERTTTTRTIKSLTTFAYKMNTKSTKKTTSTFPLYVHGYMCYISLKHKKIK